MLQDKMNKLFAAGFTITTDGQKTTFTKTVEGSLEDAIDTLLNAGFIQTNSPTHDETINYYATLVNYINQLFDNKSSMPTIYEFDCKFGHYEILGLNGDRAYLVNKSPTTYDNEEKFAAELCRALPSKYYINFSNNTMFIGKAS